MNRLTWKRVHFAAICFLLFTLWLTALNAQTQKTNVLFIMADDLNTALSGFGHPQCQTPNLDKLASRGVSFVRAYSQHPICGPSRASLLSGQYPARNGVHGNGGSLRPETVTLPRLFKDHGYWTARVSKLYHMAIPGDIMSGEDGKDHALSWTERFNIRAMETIEPGSHVRNHTSPEAIKTYPKWREKWTNNWDPRDVKKVDGGHHWVTVETLDTGENLADTMAADKAIELLKNRAEDKKPFFLAVGFVRPHFPYVAPEEDFKPYIVSDMIIPKVAEDDFEDVPTQAQGKDLNIDTAERKAIRRSYYACIRYMDRQVGRILPELETLGLSQNTIVVFTSDHGYLLGEHRLWKKNKLWEEAIRTPMIIAAPTQQAKGEKCQHHVELLDIYPTIAELAGIKPGEKIQGVSLRRLLDDPGLAPKRPDAYIKSPKGHGLRAGKWAYMWYPKSKKDAEGFMLYDMEKDPAQYTNLAMHPEYAQVKKKLHARLLERISLAE